MKRLTGILFLLLTNNVFAQDQHMIDSVTPMIRNNASREDMEIFYELGFQYLRSNHQLSLDYLNEGRAIAYKLSDSLMIVKFNRMTGQVLLEDGRQTEALGVLSNILPVAVRQGFDREVGFILKTIAVTHTYMARFDKGLEYNFLALELWRERSDSVEIANILNNIGLIHYKVGNYDRAIDYYEQALAIAENGNSPRFSALCRLLYANIGTVNIERENFNQARNWIEKSISNCSTECTTAVLVNAEFGLGYVDYSLKNYKTAGKHFMRSYKLAKSIHDSRFMAENLNYLAHTAWVENNFDSAYKCLLDAQRICLDSDYRNLLAFNYYQLFQLHKQMKQTNKASVFLEKYLELNDSIHSGTAKNRITAMEIEFDQREHALALAYQRELLAKQEAQTLLVAIICVLSLLLAAGLFIILRNKRRANHLLDQRVTERTRELESHKDALERAYQEQSEFLAKTSQSLRSAIATQKGLSLSLDEIQKVTALDLIRAREIEMDLNDLAREVSRIQDQPKLNLPGDHL